MSSSHHGSTLRSSMRVRPGAVRAGVCTRAADLDRLARMHPAFAEISLIFSARSAVVRA